MKTPITFETFREIGAYDISDLNQKYPSCFNGKVAVTKYKITIERVDEPDEVIKERIKTLWDKCDNRHHWEPLQAAAKKVGLTLTI